jgi:ABC-type nitrate/sulfonate/bicarbonate transport system substrate-binding protein
MPVNSRRPRIPRAWRYLFLAAIAIALVWTACSDDDDDELRSITFMAGFRAQANLPFVAVYVADAEGFFADEGLEVDIQHSAGQDEHVRLLLAKDIEFTTGTAAQALRRNVDGNPVQAIALFGQRGDQGFVAAADSGIDAPEDFAGRSVGFKAGVVPAELHALLATVGLTVDDVNLQGVGFDPRIFIEGEVDVFPVFLNNEPDTIRNAGLDINVFDPHDYGVPTLGVAYTAHAELVEEDPELVEAFLRATLRAVAWIEDHIDEAIEITLTHAEGADPAHQRFLLETDLANAQRDDGIGRATSAQWQALAEVLQMYGVIEVDADIDIDAAWDGSVVDALYENGEIE